MRQNGDMLILRQTVAYGGVLPFAFAFKFGDAGLLEFDLMRVSIGVILCRGRAVVCSFLHSTKQGGQCHWAMGFYVKTVILFEGFPNRLLNFFPPRRHWFILYGRLC